MRDQKANVSSYIERLRKPAGLPPFIQREVADILEWHKKEIERLTAENERLRAFRAAVIALTNRAASDRSYDGNLIDDIRTMEVS